MRTGIRALFLALALCIAFQKAGAEDKQTRYQKERDYFMHVSSSGSPEKSRYRTKDPKGAKLVDRGIKASKGLNGRHIAMWQSHGRYFDLKSLSWKWQRPPLFQTAEDLFTQSFLVPFLAPMLENAGANVLMPRERDFRKEELIIDNDPHADNPFIIHGHMELSGSWSKVPTGFADTRVQYTGVENPFTMGTALRCNALLKGGKESKAHWIGNIPSRGEYAVYVSYPGGSNSTSDARYTIHTAGGDVQVKVNQKMGGGSWVYIGSYDFPEGESTLVSLTNKSSASGVVGADAIKIGGGMGNVARGIADSTDFVTSGLPRFAEGARYFMQWSGIPDKVWSQNEFQDDYRDDLMSRGAWVKYLSAGSWANPGKKGLNIPIDLSFAWHTDAGSRPDASIVGTLGIYTLRCETGTRLSCGRPRATSRELTELLVAQIENDLGNQWDSLWTIRDVWNKSYSESRTTGTPAVLLELLSHQNFEDMKYGLDPMFRFCAARACYKAILKYLSMHYGCQYAVQPLPVHAFSASLEATPGKEKAILRWKATDDALEPTAAPTYFIIHTRVDDGGWDSGKRIEAKLSKGGYYQAEMPLKKGAVLSYKVVAGNDGGISFPSEALCVGIPEQQTEGKVTIVNAFHRISGPKWIDTEFYAGFDNDSDSGVPLVRDWAFVGKQYEFSRGKQYDAGAHSGLGLCHEDYADKVIGGNSFDYPYMHGKALIAAGYSFDSCSDDALDYGQCEGSAVLDIIAGKECRVQTGTRSPQRGGIYSETLVQAMRNAVRSGCAIMISGAYTASEAAFASEDGQRFIRDSLGIVLRAGKAATQGLVARLNKPSQRISFPQKPVSASYCVESPDALATYKLGTSIYMKYTDTGLCAAVRNDFRTYRVAAFGFPIEIVMDEEDFNAILRESMEYLCGKKAASPLISL